MSLGIISNYAQILILSLATLNLSQKAEEQSFRFFSACVLEQIIYLPRASVTLPKSPK